MSEEPCSPKSLNKISLGMEQEKGFRSREREPAPTLSLDERLRPFGLIHLGYEEEEARREASRCLKSDLRFRLSSAILPPEKWLKFNSETVSQVPESEGAFQLLDGEKHIIYIAGNPNLRQSLHEQLSSRPEAQYFNYEEDPMYTKKESELIQQFLQRHGRLPPGNEEIEDLF